MCQEINTYKRDEFYASTPPLEAKRMLFSGFARERTCDGQPIKLDFVDIRKAYFNALPKRLLHVYLPKELGLPTGKVAELLRCVYGTRDVKMLCEDTYAEYLVSIGFPVELKVHAVYFTPSAT